MYRYNEFNNLIGKTLVSANSDSDSMTFIDSEGGQHKFYHHQDCCESVYIESIVGDLQDLVGSPILTAESRTEDEPDASEYGGWTFYAFATRQGYVDVRWYGESNGYYSIDVTYLYTSPRKDD